MTIITKTIAEKKLDKQEEPLVPTTNDAEVLLVKKEVEVGIPPAPHFVFRPRARRVNTATTICAIITALLFVTVGIIGGVYLYKQMPRKVPRFHSWCNVPFNGEVNTINAHYQPKHLTLPDYQEYDDPSDEKTNPMYFKEEVQIDIEYESFEQIDVPDFSGGRRGRFIHDFSANKTGIIDIDGRRCFVMPLNRSRVLPPRNLFDLVMKMRAGYYDVDTEVVRETMHVIYPPIQDYKSIGYYIARECTNLPTYKLEIISTQSRKYLTKRSTDEKQRIFFTEFAGNKVTQIEIVD